jgi:ribosome assembly protein RRB1
MGKKSKRSKNKDTSSTAADQPRPAPAFRKNEDELETKDNLRFEDPFVDEVEEEDIVQDDEEYDDEMQDEEIVQSWNPLTGEALQEGQELEMDPSAYKMHHSLTPEWPSLSFDFIKDELGDARTRFPHTLTAVVGTQAGRSDENQITVMRLSDLSRIRVETEDDILGEEYNPDGDDDEDEDSDDDKDVDTDPILESFSIPHRGGVNRIRTMPQKTTIVATWSDIGNVNLFDIEAVVNKFSSSGKGPQKQSATLASEIKPYFVHSKHSTEGYALDWSPVKQGVMASGDCDGNIHIWTPRSDSGSFEVVPSYDAKTYSAGQVSSVEDIQWSPTEATVFCTAECRGYVRIFDTRAPNRAMLSHKIHSDGADVNVVSWNKLVTNLLACGGDDGVLSVWDLRHFSGNNSKPDPLARFATHKTPITSVEWHPTDESMLAASDDVGTYIYDLSVEEDDNAGEVDVPPQLLFVHCGSEQFKEVHWHPQISSCLMTTALSGFSVLIPSNL